MREPRLCPPQLLPPPPPHLRYSTACDPPPLALEDSVRSSPTLDTRHTHPTDCHSDSRSAGRHATSNSSTLKGDA